MPNDLASTVSSSGSYPVIVVGAGPAGLAVGACLRRAGIPALILEQSDAVGSAWRGHYDRLHLHTDRAHSGLPYFPFPASNPRYPSRLQVIAYLEAYARHFQLEPRFGQQVVSALRVDDVWEVRTRDGRFRAPDLVIATGYTRQPCLPDWPGRASFRGTLLHSSRYVNGEPFRGRSALVVGFGNSGGEIALDLWEHGARVGLAVRGAVNVIPRELLGIPILAIGILLSRLPSRLADAINAPILRAAVGDLAPFGLRQLPYGPITQIREDGRIPLIDIGTIRLIREGRIAVHPGIESFTEDGVVFADGNRAAFDVVVLATGYRPRVDAFLEGAAAAYDEDGTPSTSGREAPLPGLYFCGYHVSPTGMLREIGREARQISAAIARKHAAGG